MTTTALDPCAWLRDETEQALAWQAQQSDAARATARAGSLYDWVYAQNLEHQTSDTAGMFPPRLVGGTWIRRERGAEQPGVYAGDTPTGPARCLLGAADLADGSGGRPVQIWMFEPSPDGRYCAVAYGFGGDPTGHWAVVEVASGSRLPVHAPSLLLNVPRPGWLPGDGGFLLAERADDGAHRMNLVRLDGSSRSFVEHDLADVPATIPALIPQVSRAGTWVAALSAPHELAVRRVARVADGDWRPFLPTGYQGECYGEWRDDDTYVAIVTEGAPRGRVVAIPAATSYDRDTWTELVPESAAVLRALAVTPDGLVLLELRDVSLGIRVVTGDGTRDVVLPEHSSTIRTLLRLPQASDAVVIDHQSFLRPPSFALVDAAAGELRSLESVEALRGIAVRQQFAAAADGTPLPHYLVQRDDLPDEGVLPTLVYAYGGYNAPVTPAFLAHFTAFVRAGGRLVVANVRGGGEYGALWHEAGRLLTKQTTYDDLYAIVEHLIAQGLANPESLAFHGFSNGGATAGVVTVQRPDLWRVVVPGAPMLDFVQFVQDGPSAQAMASYFTSEFGDPTDPVYAEHLHRLSPYHNVRDGVAYPAVMAVFGASDPSCAPFSGRLFTRRLQEATTSGHPVLLRVWPDCGHGATGDQGAQWDAEWLAFVMDQLGMTVPGP